MAMKSQASMIVGPSMKMILVLIAAIGFVAFITIGSGNISKFLQDVCERYPDLPFCGGMKESYTRDHQIARNSMEALVCAINSVALGREWSGSGEVDCREYFAAADSGIIPGMDYEVVEKTINAGLGVDDNEGCRERCAEDLCGGAKACIVEKATYTETTKESESYYSREPGEISYTMQRCECIVKKQNKASVSCDEKDHKKILDIAAGSYDEAKSICDEKLGQAASTASSGEKTTDGKTIYECYYRGIACKVHNFELPQEVTNKEKYISYYGDPQFIVWWGIFPPEEDTWTFRPDWRVHALIAAISFIPPSKAIGAGIRVWSKAARAAANNMPKGLWKHYVKTQLKKSLAEILKDRLTRSGITRVIARGVVLEGAVLISKMVDSMSEKYDPKGNVLVLKSPYEDSETIGLVSEMMGRPVIVNWEVGSVFNSQAPAHLVSPCYTKYFDVRMDDITCGEYSYSSRDDENAIYCNEPKIGSKEGLFECGTFDSSIDTYLGGSMIYDMLKEELGSKGKKLWEGEGSDVKIYLPLLSEDGDQQYLTNLNLKEHAATKKEWGSQCEGKDPEWEEGDPCYETTGVYEVDIYRGSGSVGLSYVSSRDDVVMQKDKEYVLHVYWVDDYDKDNLVFDVYETRLCEGDPLLVEYGSVWPGEHPNKLRQLTCSDVKEVTSQVRTVEQIKILAQNAYDNQRERMMRITPDSDVKAGELMVNIALLEETFDDDCILNPLKAQCFRTLNSPVKNTMTCRTTFTKDKENDGNVCELDMNLDGIGSDVQILREGGEYYSSSTTFFEPEYGFGAKGFTVALEDDDTDGNWDTAKAEDQSIVSIILTGPSKVISLSDIDEEGNPQHVSMKNCHTHGVVLDFGHDLDDRLQDVDPNYCLRHRTKWAKILHWGQWSIFAGTAIVATLFAGPYGFYGVWAVMAAGGVLEAGATYGEEWVMTWP
jgi:hypothetical protein